MASDTAISRRDVDQLPAPSRSEAPSPSPWSRRRTVRRGGGVRDADRDGRTDGRTAVARRRSAVAATVLVAAVPIVVLLVLRKFLSASLWFNEQWRAEFISYPGGWLQGMRADHLASIAVGWFLVERWAAEIFGSTELVLRVPAAAFLVVDAVLIYRLGRRWMPGPAAVTVALVGSLAPQLVAYGVQLSPYDVDAASVIAVLLLFEVGHDRTTRWAQAWPGVLCYAGIGLACFVGSATVIVAAPVLMMDALGALRSRAERWRIFAIAGAGVLAIVNLVVELGQNAKGEYAYWATGYPPHGVVSQVHFYLHGLKAFVQTGLTDWPAQAGMPGALRWLLVALWTALVATGVVTVVRRRVGVALLVALVGSLLVTLVTSELRAWPWGYQRTNLFEVPLLVLLAGIGAIGAVRTLWPRRTRLRAWPGSRLWVRPARAAIDLTVLAAVVVAAVFTIGGIARSATSPTTGRYGTRIPEAVADVRAAAEPDAAVIVVGALAIPGWDYYLFEYQGTSVDDGPAIPRDHVLFTQEDGVRSITSFVARMHASEVFLYVAQGSTGPQVGSDLARLAAAGYCTTTSIKLYRLSGGTRSVARGGACPAAP